MHTLRRSAALTALLLGFYTVDLCAQSGDMAPDATEIAEAGRGTAGSPYIPVDSWIYPAVERLYDMGYLPTVYLGMRPYTRVSLAHILSISNWVLVNDQAPDEAIELYARLRSELAPEMRNETLPYTRPKVFAESAYARVRGISGPVLNDSFHFGQTIVNDYGRPYQEGINAVTGYSGYATAGRFNLYVRGEYQHAPSAPGYSKAVGDVLRPNDFENPGGPALFTIFDGPIPAANRSRLLEANLSAHLLGHQISFGRSDSWLGPAKGGSFIYSNNAEPIYAFRINRIEPLYVPYLSRVTGLFRYEFFVGSLKEHSTPRDPWLHTEKISFKPTSDIEFGFARTVIWGGKGHAPITIESFLRSFFSTASDTPAVKGSRKDPGARFSSFDFSWRIPWDDYRVMIYTDSFVHDNVFPVSNPNRAAFRPGVLINRLPYLERVSLRVEAATTDPKDPSSSQGDFLYFEQIQHQGYTNRQFLMGDAIGRENKGGNAWLTWHRKPDEQIALEYRMVKASTDFIPGGTTQHSMALNARLRPVRDVEVNVQLQGEIWKAPLLMTGSQHNVSATVGVTWFPGRSYQLK